MHPPKGGIPILDFDFPIANLLHACRAGLSIESYVSLPLLPYCTLCIYLHYCW